MKQSRKLGIAASMLAGMLAMTAPAQASLILQLSDGTETVTAADFDSNGAVLFVGSVGDWVLNVTLGVANPIIQDTNTSRLDLSSLNITGSSRTGGTLYIRLTDTDNDVPLGDTQFLVDVGGTTDGSISFQSYVDSTNAAFGTETLIYDTGLLTGSSFSGTTGGAVSVSGPYSITTYATIDHEYGYSLTGFNHGVQIPEPGSLALFGIGLLGLAFVTRRTGRKSA